MNEVILKNSSHYMMGTNLNEFEISARGIRVHFERHKIVQNNSDLNGTVGVKLGGASKGNLWSPKFGPSTFIFRIFEKMGDFLTRLFIDSSLA